MTTKALEELDGGGLGSCQAGEDLSALTDPCPGQPQEGRTQVTPRLADSSSYPPEPVAEGSPREDVDARLKKTEKEPVTREPLGPAKLTQRAGAVPRSPARKKAQAAPPAPPPPPPAASEELPWGEVSLTKCLVLASLVALLGSAFQLCRDAVAGAADTPAPVPEPWVPPRSAPKEPVEPLQKPVAWAPPPQPPAPQAEAEARGKVPGSGEECPPLTNRGPKERPLKKERPRRERPRREEKPRRAEKPRAAGEPRGALPRRGETREGGHRPWARDSGDSENRKRQAWDSPRRPNEEDRPPGRLKHRVGKGRD
ncbi:junctional sarcoplasmic reticulum protein 1 isoform X3 [Manis javanica]|uniref:junctional sarcoplasmic reticulum protein 1 isoform X3 n=1 Tax=Manis javanica TaxID=9974 RepID=UPI003C6D719B